MRGHTSLGSASWYYFSGAAGTRMADEHAASANGRCGTVNPGYLATPLPVVGEGVTEGTVCFYGSKGAPCRESVSIEVCACSYDRGASTTIVYRLPQPPVCDAAYCG